MEQLGNAEEEGGGFIGRELLASGKEKGDFGQEDSALARGDWGDVEDAGFVIKVSMMIRDYGIW